MRSNTSPKFAVCCLPGCLSRRMRWRRSTRWAARSGSSRTRSLGDLRLTFEHEGAPTDYRLELDIDSAIARLTYRLGGVRYTREVFVSHPAQAIVMRVSRRRARQDHRLELDRSSAGRDDRGAWQRSIESRGRARAAGKGLSLSRVGEDPRRRRKARGLSRAHLRSKAPTRSRYILAAATSYRGTDHRAAVERALASAAATPYEKLKAEHVADHQKLFRRVELTLGDHEGTKARGSNHEDTKTRTRWRRCRPTSGSSGCKKGETDLGLEALVFSVRPLSADCQQPSGRAAREPAGALERQHVPAVGQRLPPEHQSADELLAGRGDESRRAPSAAVRLSRVAARAGTKDGPDPLRRPRVRRPSHHRTSGASPRLAIVRDPDLWPTGAAWLTQHLWEHYLFNPTARFWPGRIP